MQQPWMDMEACLGYAADSNVSLQTYFLWAAAVRNGHLQAAQKWIEIYGLPINLRVVGNTAETLLKEGALACPMRSPMNPFKINYCNAA